MVLFLLCLLGITALGGRFVLEDYFGDLALQLTTAAQQHTERNARIRDINMTLRQTSEVQARYINWSRRIAELTNGIPSAITVAQFSVSPERYEIHGTAATRDDLLSLQRALEALPSVDRVEIPLSQLTQKENIPFSISASLHPL